MLSGSPTNMNMASAQNAIGAGNSNKGNTVNMNTKHGAANPLNISIHFVGQSIGLGVRRSNNEP